jgi:uncharacterized protein
MSNMLRLGVIAFVLLVIVGGVAFSIYRARGQAMIWVHPARTQPEFTPADANLTFEDVRIPLPDGIELSGWFVPGVGERDADGATLIFLHGLGGNRVALLDQAVMAANRGYNALLIDLRAHGESGGTVSSIGYREGDDVRAVVDYLLTRDDVNAERIGIVGFSLGAVSAVRAAASIPEIRAVVSQSGFASVEGSTSEIVTALSGRSPFPTTGIVLLFVDQEAGVPVSSVRAVDDIKRISPRPVLIMHGEQDGVINKRSAQLLYDAAGEPKELYLIPDAEHGGLAQSDPAEFERRFFTFLDTHLLGE